MANTDTSYEGYKTSLSPINKLLSIAAMVMLLVLGKLISVTPH